MLYPAELRARAGMSRPLGGGFLSGTSSGGTLPANRIAHLAVVAPALLESRLEVPWRRNLAQRRAVARLDPLAPDRQPQALQTI